MEWVVDHHPPQERIVLASECVGGVFLQLRDEFGEHGDVVTGAEGGDEEQSLDLRTLEGIGQLPWPVGRVDVDKARPDAGGGELEHQPLDVVRGPNPDPLPFLETQGEESSGQFIDAFGKLPVG